jgi:hypothetical protein
MKICRPEVKKNQEALKTNSRNFMKRQCAIDLLDRKQQCSGSSELGDCAVK